MCYVQAFVELQSIFHSQSAKVTRHSTLGLSISGHVMFTAKALVELTLNLAVSLCYQHVLQCTDSTY